MTKFRLTKQTSKQADGKFRLTPVEKETVTQVVQNVRMENAETGPLSPEMRLICDEMAQEILLEDHGIEVSIARIRRVA
jgi:hypothetical protein